MHNMFITRGFDWDLNGSGRVRKANEVLQRLGFGARVTAPASTGYMTSIEQRMNMYHLVSQALAYDVPGDLIEVGTFTGQTATLIARVLAGEGRGGQKLHVYDSFISGWGDPNPRQTLERNFREAGAPLPEVHPGFFEKTFPGELPDKIAFANIDIGFGAKGEKANAQRDLVCFILEHVYPRLSKGAVCSVIDYFDPSIHTTEVHENHGVGFGFDKFLAGRPERISVLYAGFVTQAYFRKL